jgi:hypothetical protein
MITRFNSVKSFHRSLRTILPGFAWAWCIAVSSLANAQSVIDRLSGFDEARITAVAPWLDQTNLTAEDSKPLAIEAAKLLYQVNRLASAGLPATAEENNQDSSVGSVITIRGKAVAIEPWNLPDSLADVLEFKTIYRVKVVAEAEKTTENIAKTSSEPDASSADKSSQTDNHSTAKTWHIITSKIPANWLRDNTPAENRETSATGVVLRQAGESQTAVIAAPSLSWLATADANVPADWALLGSRGFDVSLLEGVRSRDRQELKIADSASFYPLLQIAESLHKTPAGDAETKTNNTSEVIPPPANLPAADLLKQSTKLVGRRVRLALQTVRITRIAVTEEVTKQRLGSDHYWQIDALGDLGNVVIKIDSKESEDAIFENRYPVSVAIRTLPAFLAVAMNEGKEGTQTEVAMVSRPIMVEAIYYRLWSYESDFMKQHGGGNQFGPLLLASQIQPLGGTARGGSGAAGIGKYIAGFAIAGILAAALGSYYAARRDAAAKKRSRRLLPDQLAE